MAIRNSVVKLFNQLVQPLDALQQIYSKTPMSNKSSQKINSLVLLVHIDLRHLLRQLQQYATNNDIEEMKNWLYFEGKVRYMLANVKINKLGSIRTSKSFSQQEIDTIHSYIPIIIDNWTQLKNRLPVDKLKSNVKSIEFDKLGYCYKKSIPSEWL